MKKVSLFGLLGLAGLLTLFSTPIYAQDVEDDVAAVNVNNVAEEVQAEEEFNYGVDENDVTLESADLDAEAIEDVSPFLGSEELDSFLWELDVDEMSKEEAMATTWVLSAFGGLFACLWIALIVVGIIRVIFVIIALWKAFEKAWEAGWKAIIPIYNVYIMYKIACMKNRFWYIIVVAFVLWLIAWFLPDYEMLLDNISSIFWGIVWIVAMFKFARKYGRGTFTSILFAFFTWICILILGFWKSKYQGESEEIVVEA